MTREKDTAPVQEKLPSPIQLTPDQLSEVTGGVLVSPDCIIRIGIPAAQLASVAALAGPQEAI